tara:strand:- start:519 stop:821 length:303 start_codon:yes stop_codon:yes gene_type:complete
MSEAEDNQVKFDKDNLTPESVLWKAERLIDETRGGIAHLAQSISADMNRFNFMLFKVLDHIGKLKVIECSDCGETINIPDFPEIDDRGCNHCGKKLDEEE